MSLKNTFAITFKASGVSDADDGTNVFPGAMQSLSNLVPSPYTLNNFVPRPASVQATNFHGFDSQINATARVSGFTIQGTRVYGFCSTDTYPGHDEPFCFDIVSKTFVILSGVTSANSPMTQPTTGDWTPPTFSAVTNSRILATHPGFDGTTHFFGWWDISSFSLNTRTANTTSGSPVLHSWSGINSAPIQDGVEPGMLVTGTGIPANSYVISAQNGTFDSVQTGNTTALNSNISNLSLGTTGMEVGMNVAGPTLSPGTVITAITSSNSIAITPAAALSGTGVAVTVTGGGTVTISNNATATATGVAITIAGGTPSAPLWNAGNTNTNPLTAIPTCVSQYNGRAYFGVGNYLVFSDVLNPTQITNASQALQLGDSQSITAVAPLPLTSQLTGGIIASLIAFKGSQALFQITGDAATNNLTQNIISGSVGTLAPMSITGTPLGLAFISPDGLRILGFSGTQSEPIGTFGKGISVPFINAVSPSRMCAAYGGDTYRITVQNGAKNLSPHEEYWYDFNEKLWTGPHSFTCNAMGYASITPGEFVQSTDVPFSMSTAGNLNSASLTITGVPSTKGILQGMVITGTAIPNGTTVFSTTANTITMTTFPSSTISASPFTISTSSGNPGLWLSPVKPLSTFEIWEQGTIIAWNWKTSLFPDNAQQAMNAIVQSSITLAIEASDSYTATAFDDFGRFLNTIPIVSNGISTPWGSPWGSIWSIDTTLHQYMMPWQIPLVFKQGSFQLTGQSAVGAEIGNLYVSFEKLGYMM